ncbi:MAG: hypothetical protein K2Q22_06025 [Cytophagales bacterium]|nr:hypothetical protein [Cytophagales bacterium]
MFPFKTLSMVALLSGIAIVSQAQAKYSAPLKKDEFEITIYYTNDSVETTVSEVYDDENTGKPFLFSDCKRVYPQETKGLLVKNSDGQTYRALTKEEFWLFENSTGSKISTYRTRPDLYNKGQFKSIYFRSIIDTNEYIPYSRKNVLKLLEDNPKARKEMKLAMFFKTMPTVMLIVGGGLMISGFAIPGTVIPAAISIGALGLGGFQLSLGSVFVPSISSAVFYKSLNTYNGTPAK